MNCADTCENTGDNVTLPNKTPNKDVDHGIMDTGQKNTLIEPNDFRVPTEILDADTTSKVDQVMPTNNDESVEESLNLPDLGSKQPEPKPQAASLIDLPEEVADEVTLPEVHVDFGHDELASDFLDNEIDNATVLGVNAAPVADFAKEMAEEEGVDRDLELELENLTFLEEQNSKQKRKEKNLENKNNRKTPKGGKPKGHRKQSNVTPNNINNMKSTSDTTPAHTTATPGSPKDVWKTTKHGIRKNYGPSHPQNYGCKVCGQLLPSPGELNDHYRCNHPPVLCPVCKRTFSCPNTRDRHIYSHNLNKQFECDKCEERYAFESELKTHKIVHHTIKTWICARKGCDRDFKWKGDLVAHAKTHSGQVFICTICNNFSTKVEKNVKQHECDVT